MLSQQLTARTEDMSGKLVITAGPAQLPELQSLAAELKLRANIITDGDIEILTPLPPPPPIE